MCHDVGQQLAYQFVRHWKFLGARVVGRCLDEIPVSGQFHDVVVDAYIRFQNLSRPWVVNVGPKRVFGHGWKPANGRDAGVFWVPIRIFVCRRCEFANDGIFEPRLFKGGLPHFNSFFYIRFPFLGHTSTHVENDGFHDFRNFSLRI